MATEPSISTTPPQSLVTVAHVVYGLHTLSLVVGALGAATIIGAFLFGWPSIIAVILNYVKRGEARGTWLESHFRWQIRSFWIMFAWSIVGAVMLFVFIGLFVLGVAAMWFLYRAIKGWLELSEGKSMYGP